MLAAAPANAGHATENELDAAIVLIVDLRYESVAGEDNRARGQGPFSFPP